MAIYSDYESETQGKICLTPEQALASLEKEMNKGNNLIIKIHDKEDLKDLKRRIKVFHLELNRRLFKNASYFKIEITADKELPADFLSFEQRYTYAIYFDFKLSKLVELDKEGNQITRD